MSEGGGPAAATQGLVHQHQVQQHDDRSNILQKLNNYLLLWRRWLRYLNIFLIVTVFYCGASETSNLCIVSGENP